MGVPGGVYAAYLLEGLQLLRHVRLQMRARPSNVERRAVLVHLRRSSRARPRHGRNEQRSRSRQRQWWRSRRSRRSLWSGLRWRCGQGEPYGRHQHGQSSLWRGSTKQNTRTHACWGTPPGHRCKPTSASPLAWRTVRTSSALDCILKPNPAPGGCGTIVDGLCNRMAAGFAGATSRLEGSLQPWQYEGGHQHVVSAGGDDLRLRWIQRCIAGWEGGREIELLLLMFTRRMGACVAPNGKDVDE